MKYFIAAIIWSVFIAIVSFIPSSNLPELNFDLFQPDKLAHAAVYGLLALLLFWGFRRKGWRQSRIMLYAIGWSAGYGILVECAQYAFFPYRHFEIYDIIANIIGSLSGSIVAFFLIK